MAIATLLYLGGPCFLQNDAGANFQDSAFDGCDDVTVRLILHREHCSHCGESDIESTTIMTRSDAGLRPALSKKGS